MRKLGLLIAGLAVVVAFGHIAYSENYWELRDKSNALKCYVDGTSNLEDCNLNASDLASGTVNDARLSANVTVQGNAFNGASQLVQMTAATKLPAVDGSLVTGLSAAALASGLVPNDRIDDSSVTMQGNAFNGASQLVQLNGSSQLPAVSGVNLTNLNATNLASGSVNDARLSANVTVQGNSFNGASQLVQLNGSSQLPAVSGVNLTNLDASDLASGTVPNERIDKTSITAQGNAFNGASQLVKLGGDGKLPVLDGSNLTNVPTGSVAAANVSAGTFAGAFSFDTALTVNSGVFKGAMNAVAIRALTCATGAGTCMVLNSTDFDLYTATGTTAGQYRNSRTGVGP